MTKHTFCSPLALFPPRSHAALLPPNSYSEIAERLKVSLGKLGLAVVSSLLASLLRHRSLNIGEPSPNDIFRHLNFKSANPSTLTQMLQWRCGDRILIVPERLLLLVDPKRHFFLIHHLGIWTL